MPLRSKPRSPEKKKQQLQYDQRRYHESWRGLYNKRRWKRIRLLQLQNHPACQLCGSAATIAHHIKDHKGDLGLFFDTTNLASRCESCHNKLDKQRELMGYSGAMGVDGYPLDPHHPFNGGGE